MRRIVLALALVLPVAAATVLLLEPAAAPDDEFQRLVGGLGLGPAVDLSRCAGDFDPRVAPACAWRHGPLPCADYFCPEHAFPK